MTDNRKISIIVDLHSENENEAFFNSLEVLMVPDGYQCDVIAVKGAASRVAAYNEGCRNNDAKYKVYIDSRVRIIATDFLCKVIEIFQLYNKIAVVDVSGNTVIPTNGICITGLSRVGGYQSDNDDTFVKVEKQCVEAAAVDGFVFATQHDLSWQKNEFKTDRLAMTAQCVEYKKLGYKLAVIQQNEPCIALNNTKFLIDENERNKFLDLYSCIIYPKVLIVIPTYNRPEYLQAALKSAMTQTYRNIEIVISDDSTNDETARIIPAYLERDKRIKYFKHENYAALDNSLWIIRYIKASSVEYFNHLMDDDMLYPTKIEKMMTYYLEYEGVSLVTSYRHIIDANGTVLPDYDFNRQVFNQNTIVPGYVAGRAMLESCCNFVGEFSTTLLKKSLLLDDVLYGYKDKMDLVFGLMDVSTWLQLLSKGNLVYMAEPLSAFRIHETQLQSNEGARTMCILHWGRLIKFAMDNNVFLTDEINKRTALTCWFNMLHIFLLRKTKLANTDDAHEGFIYEKIERFIAELDDANITNQQYNEEQILNDPLPLKRKFLF